MTDQVAQDVFRTPGGRSATMRYRLGTNCWNTLSACMTEDEYGMAARGGAATMIDVGGYLGGVGIGYSLDNREARVWIVEPLPANCDLIRANIELNGLADRVTLVEAAADRPGRERTTVLWDFSDDESGRHHRFVGNSSLAAGSPSRRSAAVPCVSLPDLVAMAGGFVDLLKVDCEGGEYALFEARADGVGDIVGEQHGGFDRLEALLRGTHDVTNDGTLDFGAFHAVRRRPAARAIAYTNVTDDDWVMADPVPA